MRSGDVVRSHIAFVVASGIEFALWRGDDSTINAWENRCPHRGVRLTIGSIRGNELVCRYHGWRFATGSGACTHIPAHPAQTPPRAADASTYAATERYGLVWVHLGLPGGDPEITGLGDDVTTLRSMWIDAPFERVSDALADVCEVLGAGRFRLRLGDDRASSAVLLPQLVDCDTTVVHGIVEDGSDARTFVDCLHRFNDRLKSLRRVTEAETSDLHRDPYRTNA